MKALTATEVGRTIDFRLSEFKEMGRKGNEEWFSELCFCILTANSSARLGLKIQNEIGASGFLSLPEESLALKLVAFGHRFARHRAGFIVRAREYRSIKDIVSKFESAFQAREWLVENVMGIGYKEGSHFLRNVGFDNIAILDRHVLRVMCESQLINEIPKSLTRKRYLELEDLLSDFAARVDLLLSKLDLCLWYMKTGNVFK